MRHSRLVMAIAAALAASACMPPLPTSPEGDPARPRRGAATSPAPATSAAPTIAPSATPAPAAFFGRVLGLDGQPAAGVPVRGFLLSNNGAGLISDRGGSLISNNGGGYRVLSALETKTDEAGFFELKDPEGRPLNLEAVKSSREKAIRMGVASDAASITMQLALTGRIAGKVLPPPEVPASDMTGVDVFVPGTGYGAKTAADGSFVIDEVPVGQFKLVAAKRGLGKALVEGVAVKSEQTTQAPNMQLAVKLPTIMAIAPANAGPGLEVTITGTDFGASAGQDFSVTFGGATASTPDRVDDRTIKVKVPTGARSGDVVVTVDGVPGPAAAFTVIQSIATTSALHDLMPGNQHRFPLLVKDTEGVTVEEPVVSWRVTGTGLTVDAAGQVTATGAGSGTLVAESGAVALAPFALTVHDAPWVLTTIAGREAVSPFDRSPYAPAYEGVGVGMEFYQPSGLVVDAEGVVFVADQGGAVCRISPDGEVTVLAGAYAKGTVDAKGAAARFNQPAALALGADGTLYVGDKSTVRRIGTDGTVTPLAGSATTGFTNATGASAAFEDVLGLALAENGDLFVLDAGNQAVRRVTTAGVVTTVATGLGDPTAMAIGPDGHLYVADGGVKQVTTAGVVTPVSGLTEAEAVAVAADGTIYVAESFGYVKARDPAGNVTTVAADGSYTSKTTDGTGDQAGLSYLHGLALGPDGTLYLSEWGYDYVLQRVRKLQLGD